MSDEQSALIRQKRSEETIRSFKTKRTQVERWTRIEEVSDKTLWDNRARAAVDLIPMNVRVLDLGCGDMKIERLLPEGCSYIPADVVKRDSRTVVIDLNKQRLPEFGADFVLGLGVLEYLFDITKVLKQLSRQAREGLFSYHPMNQSPKKDRLALGWVNSLNESELMAILRYSGYKTVVPHVYKPGLMFYHVHRDRDALVSTTESELKSKT